MQKRKINIWIALIVVFVVAIYFFSSQKENQQESTIKIGAIIPLTGNLASLGQDIQEGILLAAEDINSKEERKLEIIFEDSKGDPSEAVSIVNKLIDVDGVKYIYCVGTPILNAIQPITEEKGVVLAAVSLDNNIVKDKEKTVRIYYNSMQFLDNFVDFIRKEKYEKLVTLYQKIETLDNQIKYLEEEGVVFEKTETFDMNEQDFRTVLLKIKEADLDSMLLMGYGFHFPQIFKQMKQLGMEDIIVIGNINFLQVPEESLSLYNNAIFSVPAFKVFPSEKSKDFISKYEKLYDKEPTIDVAYAYDTASLIYEAAINTNGDPQKVSECLKNIGEYSGVVGKIEILKNGDSRSSEYFATYNELGEVVSYQQ